ncbi:DUF998 domain-containing protein [Nonomuraea longicatena]|uniref:DUF998 domain-containing protein n=1 Tax=Nonomuraea longicatena TaxID=83682 RepID=A0ABN1PBU3_9ACTN
MTTTITRGNASTRTLLTAAAAAMPVWTVLALTQAFTREGFDLVRHPFSQLATGSLGWIQIANFLIVGPLLIAGSLGFRKALHGKPGATWVPRLTRIAGIGMIGAGVFVVDAGYGFPVGTPAGPPAEMSWHAVLHMVAGSVTFLAFAAVCFILGRYFTRAGARGMALLSRLAGAAVIVGDGWAITGGHAGSVTLATGVVIAMGWISLVAAHLRKSA